MSHKYQGLSPAGRIQSLKFFPNFLTCTICSDSFPSKFSDTNDPHLYSVIFFDTYSVLCCVTCMSCIHVCHVLHVYRLKYSRHDNYEYFKQYLITLHDTVI